MMSQQPPSLNAQNPSPGQFDYLFEPAPPQPPDSPAHPSRYAPQMAQIQQHGYAPAVGPNTPYGYAPATGPAQPYAPARKPSILGILALVVVGVSAVILSAYMWRACLVTPRITASSDAAHRAAFVQALRNQMGIGFLLLGNVSIGAGLVGWILGIVAAATKNGRAYGVVAIILGALAPFIAFGMGMIAIATHRG